MPTQVSIGPLSIDRYTMWVALFALAGMGIAVWRSRSAPVAALNALLVVAVCALAGGRAGYVALNWSYFAEHPGEVLSLASPGYSEQAAILGALFAVWVCRRLRLPVDPVAFVVVATLAGAGASIGCASRGCGYGREVYWTDGAWWLARVDWPDQYLNNAPRLPSQAAMAAWLLVCGFIALLTARRFRPAATPGAWLAPIAVWVAAFAAGDFVLQFLRADPAATAAGLRGQQWLDALLTLVAAFCLIRAIRHGCDA